MRTRHPDPAARPPERLCATVPATRVQPNATPCNIPAKSLRPARPSSHNPTPLARNEPTACYKKLQIATTLSIAPRAPAQNKPTADRTPHAGAQRRERKRPNAAPDSSNDQSHPPAQIKPTKRAKQCQTPPNPTTPRAGANQTQTWATFPPSNPSRPAYQAPPHPSPRVPNFQTNPTNCAKPLHLHTTHPAPNLSTASLYSQLPTRNSQLPPPHNKYLPRDTAHCTTRSHVGRLRQLPSVIRFAYRTSFSNNVSICPPNSRERIKADSSRLYSMLR